MKNASTASQLPDTSTHPLTLYPAWCKRCGICIAFCPKSVFDTAPAGGPVVARPTDCIRCHLCELRCPDFAISVSDDDPEAP